MSVEAYESYFPEVHESAFIASSADLIGRVSVGEASSVWYNATLRGDINSITIGDFSNVQDNVVIHVSDDFGVELGKLVTIGHSAIIHACKIEDEVLIGMGATILDGAIVGKQSIIGANCLVTRGMVIPPGSLVYGSPAKVVEPLTKEKRENVKYWAEKYVKQSRKYLERSHP